MRLWRAVFSVLVVYLACVSGGAADTARAALSESGGTGILELQSAESKRPARLEIGFSGSYRQFELHDAADTRLNVLRGAANAAFGLPGGFETLGHGPGPVPLHESGRGGLAPGRGTRREAR